MATTDSLLGPSEIRRLAAELDLRPTKVWGQNFVIDPNTVRRIVRRAEVGSDDRVLEVGPGLGSLTLALLEVAGAVAAVEIDPRLATRLPQTVAERDPERAASLTVVNRDALTITAADLPWSPTALVANLPYNVAVPVLLHLWEQLPGIDRTLVMVQAEVAARLAARPGGRIYGVPSAKAAWYGSVDQAGTIGQAVFWPVPNVDSGLVLMRRHAAGQAPADRTTATRAQVFAVIDAAFAQRRKMLRSALAGLAGGKERADAALAAAGVPSTARGEQLDIMAFCAVAAALAGQG